MADSVKLGVGDNPTVDFIELIGLDSDAPYALLDPDGLQIPDPPLKDVYVGAANRDGADLVEHHFENRVIPLRLEITGTDIGDLVGNVQAINRYLSRAAHYAETGDGDPIVLTVRLRDTSSPTFFDVLSGTLELPQDIGGPNIISAILSSAVLTLTCRPFGRMAPELFGVSGTLNNNDSAVVNLNGIGGDVPALCQVRVTDTSSSGAVNWLLAALYSERQGGIPTNKVWAKSLSTAGGSASQAETDSLNGTTVIRATPSSEWASAATVSVTANLTENEGWYRLILRVRDNSGIAPPTTAAAYLRTGGTKASSTNYYKWTAKLGAGETIAGPMVSQTPYWYYDTIRTETGAVTGATSYEVYRRIGSGGTWYHRNNGTSRSYTDTSDSTTGWTLGDSPDESSALSPVAQVRLKYGFTNDADVNLHETPYIAVGSGGQFLDLDFGLHRLPPRKPPTGYASPGYRVLIEHKQSASATGSVDYDALYFIPYGGVVAEASYPSRALATKYLWVLDQTNDEQLSAMLVNIADSVPVGTVSATGRLVAQPGANQLFLMARQASDVHAISATTFTAQARVVPRVRHLAR